VCQNPTFFALLKCWGDLSTKISKNKKLMSKRKALLPQFENCREES
jgi:hypothetical protein